MKHLPNKKVLCVPNLQGERHNIPSIQQDWVSIKQTLPEQCTAIEEGYQEHIGILGTSFGGLAVWRTVSMNPTLSAEFIILIDVIPSLGLFPRWKGSVLRMLQWVPAVLSQQIYSVNRFIHGYRTPVNFQDILQRIFSFQEHFPNPIFPVPTLIISRNPNFHREWEHMASFHPNITAVPLEKSNIQIERWINLLQKSNDSDTI